MHKEPNLTLPSSTPRSTQNHHLYKLGKAGIPSAKYSVPKSLGSRDFKGLTL